MVLPALPFSLLWPEQARATALRPPGLPASDRYHTGAPPKGGWLGPCTSGYNEASPPVRNDTERWAGAFMGTACHRGCRQLKSWSGNRV